MALLGGGVGGAGNPVGGSFTGPAEALEYIGEHVYAYSGSIIVNNSTETCLSFTTGSSYVVAEFREGVDFTNVGTKFVGFTIQMNGAVIVNNYHTVDSGGKNESNTPSTYQLIIPPYTEIITQASTDSAADIPFYHLITGRKYRTRD